MKRVTLFALLLLLLSAMPAAADKKQPTPRQQWFKELAQYKRDFMIKELCLNEQQQQKFFPVYEEMEKKIMKANDETRALERKIDHSKEKVSDLEYEKAAEAQFEVKAKEAAIEASYLPKFKQILTPKQLYKLKHAEKKWTRELMKQHQIKQHQNKKAK